MLAIEQIGKENSEWEYIKTVDKSISFSSRWASIIFQGNMTLMVLDGKLKASFISRWIVDLKWKTVA